MWKVGRYSDGMYYYFNEKNQRSVTFKKCWDYDGNGFGRVKNRFGNIKQYRDILGNVTNGQTQLGKDIYSLHIGKKTVFDICDECFLDPKAINVEELANGKTRLTGFIAEVLQREYERYISAIGDESVDYKAQIEQTEQYFKKCLDYCVDKMEQVRSDYYEKEQRKIDRNTAINSALQEDILTF